MGRKLRLSQSTALRLMLRARNGKSRRHLACSTFLNSFEDISDRWEVALDTAYNLLVNVLEVVEGHPRFTKVLTQQFSIESKLHEDVHFGGFLAHHELTVVGW